MPLPKETGSRSDRTTTQNDTPKGSDTHIYETMTYSAKNFKVQKLLIGVLEEATLVMLLA